MDRLWFPSTAELSGPQLHLLFLAIMGIAAVVLGSATAWVVVRKPTSNTNHTLTRSLGLVSTLMISLGLWLALDTIVLGPEPATAELRQILGTQLTFVTTTALVLGATAAAPRSAVLMASIHGMAGLGMLVYTLLLSAVPPSVDPTWELEHLLEFGLFSTAGFSMLLAAGLLTSRQHRPTTLSAYALTAAIGLLVVTQIHLIHPEPRLSVLLPTYGALLGSIVWVGQAMSGKMPNLRRQAERTWEHPVTIGLMAMIPIMVTGAALVLGGSGSARAAARIQIVGLSITPGLITPFVFAVALGGILGQERWRWSGWSGLALTGTMAVLLFAQKEVGNIAVLLMVASVVYLIARGTILHLATGISLAIAGIIAAYQLAPFYSVIPFTFRERLHLWLGGAELLQRGGHLLTASHITYGLGGFWGLGIHDTPRLNLTRMVIAIHTDFPLTVLGLYGGAILLSIYVVFLTSAALLMLDTIGNLNFQGDPRRARRLTPLLAGLMAVPVGSTALNLAGAITQVTPFTGVPVMLVSYSSIFLLSTFASVAVFIVVGNRNALQTTTRTQAERAQAQHQTRVTLNLTRLPKQKSTALPPPQQAQETWWKPARLRLSLRSLKRHTRLSRIDGGLALIGLALIMVAAIFIHQLYTRYTDQTRYYGHARLKHAIQLEPMPGQPGRWSVTQAPNREQLGPLREHHSLQLDTLLLRIRDGLLQVHGACFPTSKARAGIALGFEGTLDAPPLPWVDDAVRPAMDRWGQFEAQGNDIIVPWGDIALRHLMIRQSKPGRYHIEAMSPLSHHTRVDGRGLSLPHPYEAELRANQGFTIGLRHPHTFLVEERAEQVCLRLQRGALAQYPLSVEGPTVLGSMALRRRALVRRTTDFAFARDLKAAAEAGILTAAGPEGPLKVIPYSPKDRSRWDPRTRQLFFALFRILKLSPSGDEVLAWSRPFYADGGRRFSSTRELDAFIIHGTRVLGLADSNRFSRPLPVLYDPMAPERNGLLHDRHGTPITTLESDTGAVTTDLPGATPLLGYDFRRRGVRDGLLRVFAPALRGTTPIPDVQEELNDHLNERRRGPWGHDIQLTLDAAVQAHTFHVLAAETRKLNAREPEVIHHASAVVLGPRNDVIAVAQWPDPGSITTVQEAIDYKQEQRESPLDAPGLDAFQRRTTMGSTIKLLTMIAAFRHKEDTLLNDDGRWYLNARDDPPNASRGRYIERGGSLRSWRGQAIAPIHNYGKARFGKVVPLRTLLVDSLNTGAAYMGLNVGRSRYEQLFTDIGLTTTIDLLPGELHRSGTYGHLIHRYRRDAASALPVSIGAIPKGEPWTPSLTARLPLSGLSDYSVMTTALGASIVARNGLYWPPRLVQGMRDRRTQARIHFAPSQPVRILAPQDAETITSYMKDVIRRGTGGGYRWKLPHEVWMRTGGKTGTGETVVPIDPDAVYTLADKPPTRDNKAFVAVWPTDSPQPFVVTVVFEQISHLDKGVAVRAAQQIMEGVRYSLASSKE